MALTKFAGTSFTFPDGRTLVLPPLSLRQFIQLQPRLSAFNMQDAVQTVDMGLVVDTVHAAASRNYPELTWDDVADSLDIPTGVKAFLAVMDVTKLVNEAVSGEAVATA